MLNEVVVVNSDRLGSGDDKLGAILMSSFLRLLGQRDEMPEFVILYNAAVKLALANSETVDFLKVLQERGVTIISCRTCVEYFGIADQIGAGEIDGMVRIQEILLNHNVVTV